jgi:hypothetical protein
MIIFFKHEMVEEIGDFLSNEKVRCGMISQLMAQYVRESS